MDGRTKNALWDFWTKGGDDEVLMGDIVSSFDEHKPKTYKRNVSELDDISVSNNPPYLYNEEEELLNEGMCKSEKFNVIRYSLGTNEEYFAINTCEYDAWKRTEGIMSSVYHEIFRKKDQGWLVATPMKS
ncbi:hypothetical protein Tco_1456907 [Tanacetum coccineum]